MHRLCENTACYILAAEKTLQKAQGHTLKTFNHIPLLINWALKVYSCVGRVVTLYTWDKASKFYTKISTLHTIFHCAQQTKTAII